MGWCLAVGWRDLQETLGYALCCVDVVGWAASLDPSPEVIHIDLRSPTRN